MKRPFNAREFVSSLVMNLAPAPGLYAFMRVGYAAHDRFGFDVGRWIPFSFAAGVFVALVFMVPIGFRLHDWASKERR
jgi:hypothetical protein